MEKQLESYKKLMEQMEVCYKELAEIIKSKGGLIKITYEGELPDYMYAEGYNSSGEICEYYIHGLSVDDEGNISVASSYWVEEDDDFLDDEENWDALYCGQNLLYGATLLNIMEVIHEYI